MRATMYLAEGNESLVGRERRLGEAFAPVNG